MQLRRTLIGVLASLCALTMPMAVGATSGINTIGTLERYPQEAFDAFGPGIKPDGPVGHFLRIVNGTLLPVPGVGQLWQVYYLDNDTERTGVLVRDARSLKVLDAFVVGARLRRATLSATAGGEWLHATDGGNRVFVVSLRSSELLEIDATTHAVRSLGTLRVTPLDPVFHPFVVAGLTYDPITGDLLVVYGGVANNNILDRVVVLERIDLTTGIRQSRVVRSCTGGLPQTEGFHGDTYAAELLLGSHAVYLTCHAHVAFPITPIASQVVKLPRASLWDSTGEESSVATGGPADAALVDPGSGRIAVLGVSGEVAVVDTTSMSLVGTFDTNVGAQTPVGAGLDRSTGRFFFQSDRGFGYVDIRSRPLPFPTADFSGAGQGQERIVPVGTKAFVLPGWSIFPSAKPDRYTIYNVAP